MMHTDLSSAKQQAGGPKRPDFIPGELVVKFKEDVVSGVPNIGTMSVAAMRALKLPQKIEEPFQAMRRRRVLKEVVPVFMRSGAVVPGAGGGVSPAATIAVSLREAESEDLKGITLLRFSKSASISQIERDLRETGGIEYQHRVPARWAAKGPGPAGASADPMVNRQWGLRAIRWFDARPMPNASSVRVAVLDTGVDTSHPDLRRVVQTYDPGSASAEDIVGHGTHVCGIIGASPDNHVGIAGVCKCDLYVWKIFGDKPATDGEYYVDELAYQRALNAARNGNMQVVNLSIGGTQYTQTEALLIRKLIDSGTTVVAAMGNEYHPFNPTEFPASYPGVIAVGAINESNRRAAFSNTGKHIALSAPGTNVLSTLPMKQSKYRTKEETQYAAWSGTSMATPHVTAAAALVMARNPRLKPADVAKRLRQTATRVPAMGKKKRTDELGNGLLNLRDAVS